MADKELQELIEGLERVCDLYEKLQEKIAILEAGEILEEANND